MSQIASGDGLLQKAKVAQPETSMLEDLEAEVSGIVMDIADLGAELRRIAPLTEPPLPESPGQTDDFGLLYQNLEGWTERLQCQRRILQNARESMANWANQVIGPPPVATLGGPG